MKQYFDDRVGLAQFVVDNLIHLRRDLPWTMTIRQEKSEDYSVHIVTDTSSADTDETQAETNSSEAQATT